MIEIFTVALQNNNIVSICVGNVDWNKRIIGYVRSVNSNSVVIGVVDVFGDVIKIKKLIVKSITVVEINDAYNQHLEKLKTEGKVIKTVRPLYYFNKGKTFSEKIEILRLGKSICTIFFGTEYMTGIVKKTEKGVLFISSIGYRGTKDGESYCRLKYVTKIRYEGPLENKITYLRNL